jgi:D-3-phosphoglycerate dehydrogenase
LGKVLGMTVVITDPAPECLPERIGNVTFDTLLAMSDFVVCLAPSIPETAGMFNARAFAMMKSDAMFINLARGELVDEDALIQALDARKIACAAMDVGSAHDQRPPLRLATRDDVIATPHIGGQTPQASEGQAMHVVSQVLKIVNNEIPDNAVNADAASRLNARIASSNPNNRITI